MQDKHQQLATDSLVQSVKSRVDNSLPPMSGASRKPSPTLSTKLPALDPMPPEIAAKLVRRLLAGYPNLKNLHDPDGYIAALTETMAGYPAWAGERAVLRVDEKGDEFPPSEKTLRSWLNEAVAPYKFAAQWNARVEQQLKDRAESGRETDSSQTPPPADGYGVTWFYYRNAHEAVAKHGRPIGRFETERKESGKPGDGA